MTATLLKFARALLVGAVGLAGIVFLSGSEVGAAEAPVGLGTAGSFTVLAASTVTNTGPSVITGDLGVSPGSAVVGFPPGVVNSGAIHAADAVAAQAQADVTTAYNDAAGRAVTANVAADLSGSPFVSGVYRAPTFALGVNATVTLDGQGDPNAVFIFQAGSTLTTGSASVVSLINGADACNVYWQIGSSATLGTNSVFVGTILALTSVTAQTGATVAGRLLARNGAVTLDDNTVARASCAAGGTTTTTGAGGSTSTTATSATTSTTSTTATTATTSTTLVSTSVTTSTSGSSGTTAGSSGGATTAAATGTTSSGSSSGDGSTGSATSRLARTGWQLTSTAAAGVMAIIMGFGMLLASRREPAPVSARRYRC
ncbi:MAG TPA: ice-binding family protein [Acidimicrobiales bacterium]|nr:ice-binding family protein [Acidimicrobiales bacterium]